MLDAVFSMEFLTKHEHVLLVGPAGVGKSFLAQTLGFTAIRAGHTVRFIHSDDFFRAMAQAQADNSLERTFRSFLTPDLLILDDLGLHRLTAQQSADLYELILNRHRGSSFVITSNRAVDEWLSLFDDPILGNSALDRLANASYQIVIEGTSYRERLSPHRKLRGLGEVIDPSICDLIQDQITRAQGGLMSVKIPGLMTLDNNTTTSPRARLGMQRGCAPH